MPAISTYFTFNVELLASSAALVVFLSSLGVNVTLDSNTGLAPEVLFVKSFPITSDVDVTLIGLRVSPNPGVTTTLYVPAFDILSKAKLPFESAVVTTGLPDASSTGFPLASNNDTVLPAAGTSSSVVRNLPFPLPPAGGTS